MTLREALEKHLGHCLTDAQFAFYCSKANIYINSNIISLNKTKFQELIKLGEMIFGGVKCG